MQDDLEEKVKQRIKESEEKNIGGKAHAIGKMLGLAFSSDEGRMVVKTLLYQDNHFCVQLQETTYDDRDGGYSNIRTAIISTINPPNQASQVYVSSNGKVEVYIPGEWETKLNELYMIARETKQPVSKKEKQDRRREERKTG